MSTLFGLRNLAIVPSEQTNEERTWGRDIYRIRSTRHALLHHTRRLHRRHEHEILLPYHLHVDVLVVVPVQRGYRPGIPDPEVYGVGAGGVVEGDARPAYVALYVCGEGRVFVAEVVIFWGVMVRGVLRGGEGKGERGVTGLGVFDICGEVLG